MSLEIYMPEPIQRVMSKPARYRVLSGGRGSAKSYAVANYLIIKAISGKYRILCTREYQSSIKDSVHKLLSDRIRALGLSKFFIIQRDSIRSIFGSEFIFKGLRHSISEIKSTEGIDFCWCEEAEKISEESWNVLIPTIRAEGSEIIITFNPDEEKSATWQRFVVSPPPRTEYCHTTYVDNKLFPEVLRWEMEYDKKVDFERYEHVWEGKLKKYANALIFKGKYRVDEFETPESATFLLGADFGYADDPSCMIRGFIQDNKLFIDYEAYAYHVEIDDLPTLFRSVPGSDKWKSRGDNARPDTISYLKRHGINMEPCEKGKNSVEEGISFLRSFEEIVIHPRCKYTARDFGSYKWKTDKHTNEILPIPGKSSDHAPDACRYMIRPYMTKKRSIFDAM